MENLNIKKRNLIIIITLVGLLIISILLIVNNRKPRVYETNANMIVESIHAIAFEDDQPVAIGDLSDIIPFEWDKVIFFGPYATEEYIYEIVGYKWTRFVITGVNEGMNQAVFIMNDEVVCHIQGYPDKYQLYFEVPIQNGHVTLYEKQRNNIEIRKNDELYIIKYRDED